MPRIDLLLLLLLSAQVFADTGEETTRRYYPVPEHGELVLNVPSDWEVTYVETGKVSPPVITFFRKDVNKQELFQLNLSILWDDGFERNILDPEHIRQLVEDTGKNALAGAEQSELSLLPLAGEMGSGYFFNLADAEAKAGEYRYLTQGALSVGELLVVFSLFTHQPDDHFLHKSLQMIQTATHRLQRHVALPLSLAKG